ncbi:hypothetical protein Glove_85g99 [Diversispora epigaea]|uniref:Uncharacterized protein n=1 Tax=Diversispora epigaea TaxID=1348612 RepID=A0A397JDX6_9GLOM|nr:hypothetical protein Glove_85g99 [Diversispora epigaea]
MGHESSYDQTILDGNKFVAEEMEDLMNVTLDYCKSTGKDEDETPYYKSEGWF